MSSKQYMAKLRKAAGEMKEIPEGSSLDQVIAYLNVIVSYWNITFRKLSFRYNFDCQLIEAEFAASEELRIPHKLGIVPRHRLILNQEGNGLLTDVTSGWTTTYVTMKNNGADAVKAVIMLVKE